MVDKYEKAFLHQIFSYNTLMRKFAVFLAASLLTFLLFATAMSVAAVITFTPANLKKWLKDSNVYATAIDNVFKANTKLNTDSSGGSVNLQDPIIQGAIKKTFNPQLLQSGAENIIDGTNQWLTGKATLPTFDVDLTAAKTSLAQQLGGYALQRFSSLPLCTTATPLPTSDDILDATCRPAGYNPAPQVQQLVANVQTSKDFLANPHITAMTVTSNDANGQPQSVFVKAKNAPRAYKWAQRSPIILGILALLSGVLVIFISITKRKGLRVVATSSAIVGGLLLLAMWGASEGFHKLNVHIQATKNDSGIDYKITVLKISDSIRQGLSHTLVEFGIGFIVLAVIIFVVLFFTRSKTLKTGHSDDKKPPAPKEEEKKPEEAPVARPKPPVLVQARIPSI